MVKLFAAVNKITVIYIIITDCFFLRLSSKTEFELVYMFVWPLRPAPRKITKCTIWY